jgi:hypothetical protein
VCLSVWPPFFSAPTYITNSRPVSLYPVCPEECLSKTKFSRKLTSCFSGGHENLTRAHMNLTGGHLTVVLQEFLTGGHQNLNCFYILSHSFWMGCLLKRVGFLIIKFSFNRATRGSFTGLYLVSTGSNLVEFYICPFLGRVKCLLHIYKT